MDLKQEQLARSMGEGHRIIHGVAGSGKTMILGYRINYLAQALQKPILVLTSGANRVDETRLAAHLGEAVQRADPAQVRLATGFAIGGVPPIGHATSIECYLDEDLLQYELLWAAAGNPKAMFAVSPAALQSMSRASVLRVKT
jgi:prolyl-tRNA editing enzyme YbaK/EbsC (Cys-tRNA(Pro) deacylase)